MMASLKTPVFGFLLCAGAQRHAIGGETVWRLRVGCSFTDS